MIAFTLYLALSCPICLNDIGHKVGALFKCSCNNNNPNLNFKILLISLSLKVTLTLRQEAHIVIAISTYNRYFPAAINDAHERVPPCHASSKYINLTGFGDK